MEAPLDGPLDLFECLPLELRGEIYSYFLDDDFKQVHNINPLTGIITRPAGRQSPLPLVLGISKAMRHEVADTMLYGRIAEIEINERAIVTNFSTLDLNDLSQSLTARHWDLESRMTLPLNRPLHFTIRLPELRSHVHSYKIRHNVAKVVQIINSQAKKKDKKPPKIIVKLATPPGQTVFNCSMNDFSMVVAPFLRLKSDRYETFKIEHHPRVMPYYAKLHNYCNHIEDAMTNGLDTRGPLFNHQAMLDVKLPLCIYNTNFIERKPLGLGCPLATTLGEEIQEGLEKARAWHTAVGRVEPKWLNILVRVGEERLVLKEAERATLWGDVFQGNTVAHLQYWAAGLMTTWNPFFSQEEGEKIAGVSDG